MLQSVEHMLVNRFSGPPSLGLPHSFFNDHFRLPQVLTVSPSVQGGKGHGEDWDGGQVFWSHSSRETRTITIVFCFIPLPCGVLYFLRLPLFHSGGSHVHHAGSRLEVIQRHICSIESLFNPVAQT